MEHLTLNLVAVGALLVAAGLFHEFLPGALIKRQLKEERFGMLTCSQMARGSVTRFRDVAELLKIFLFFATPAGHPKGLGQPCPKLRILMSSWTYQSVEAAPRGSHSRL